MVSLKKLILNNTTASLHITTTTNMTPTTTTQLCWPIPCYWDCTKPYQTTPKWIAVYSQRQNKQSPKNVQSFLGTKFWLRTFLTHIFTNYCNFNIKWRRFPINLSKILTFMLIMSYFLELSCIIYLSMLNSEEIR